MWLIPDTVVVGLTLRVGQIGRTSQTDEVWVLVRPRERIRCTSWPLADYRFRFSISLPCLKFSFFRNFRSHEQLLGVKIKRLIRFVKLFL